MNRPTLFSLTRTMSLNILLVAVFMPALAMASDIDHEAETESDKNDATSVSAKKYPTAKLNGRLQLRHDDFDGVYSDSSQRETADYIARANIQLSGKLMRQLQYQLKVEMDEKDKVFVKTASLSYRFSKRFRLVLGHFKPEFGMEQMGSSSWSTGIERSAIWNLAPDISDAAEVNTLGGAGIYKRKHLYLSIAGLHKSSGYNWTVRAVTAPIQQQRQVLHLGVSYLDERADDQDGQLRTRLGVLGVSVNDHGNRTKLARATANAFGDDQSAVLEFAYLIGPLSVQSEYLRRHLYGIGAQQDRIATGSYIQLAYTLTGESRNYQMDGAKFSGMTPHNKKWGAWEIFYRRDDLKVRGEEGMLKKNRSTADASVDVVGVNWYAPADLRLSINYLQADTNGIVNNVGVDEGNALSAQLQWLF